MLLPFSRTNAHPRLTRVFTRRVHGVTSVEVSLPLERAKVSFDSAITTPGQVRTVWTKRAASCMIGLVRLPRYSEPRPRTRWFSRPPAVELEPQSKQKIARDGFPASIRRLSAVLSYAGVERPQE